MKGMSYKASMFSFHTTVGPSAGTFDVFFFIV